MAPPRRHIWSEFVPYDRVRDRALLAALSDRSIQLIVAVTPRQRHGLARVVAACRDAGVAIGVWPMLADEHGRWVSAANAARFGAFARAVLTDLDAAGVPPDEVVLDLEPPIDQVSQLLGSARVGPGPRRGGRARRVESASASPSVAAGGMARDRAPHAAVYELRTLAADARARGLAVSAAVVPMAVIPPERSARGWQRLLGTPADALALDRVSTMAYTSLLQGYSRGAVRRADAVWLLAALAGATRARYGVRAGVSVGAVGAGALGDEDTYRSPRELAEDVAIARAAGVDDIALFNLGGALARPPVEAWLDALVYTAPAPRPARPTLRALAAWRLARIIGHAAACLLPAPRP